MEEEFTEILYKHQGIVHKICHLYFHDRADKDDYKQELIIQLWKAYPKFKQQSKFSTWMYRVCLNAAIDILRKEKAQPTFVKQDLESTLSESHNEPNNNRELLYQAINLLSVIDKAIITLYLEEFSYKEISDIMGISESNTGVKINRIKSSLSKSIENGKL